MPDTVTSRMVDLLSPEAEQCRVTDVRIGLGYTAVLLADGGLGVAYTFHEHLPGGCAVFRGLRPLAPRSASELLPLLGSSDLLEAAVGLACANALANRPHRLHQSGDLLEQLELNPDDDVAMVGHFAPLVAAIKERARSLTIFEQVDQPQGPFRPAAEAHDRLPECQVAIITATAIINHTLDGLLEAARHCREVAIVGASTPLLGKVFEPWRVTLLSGVVAETSEGILRVVSEGGGMRQFKPHVRKVSLRLDGVQ